MFSEIQSVFTYMIDCAAQILEVAEFRFVFLVTLATYIICHIFKIFKPSEGGDF